MDNENKLPLALFKQACMKLDSVMGDLYEIREDINLDPADKDTITQMTEMAGVMEACLINIVKKECDEDDFLNESVPMDNIDPYSAVTYEDDILDTNIDFQ